jgi:hypothetical protein
MIRKPIHVITRTSLAGALVSALSIGFVPQPSAAAAKVAPGTFVLSASPNSLALGAGKAKTIRLIVKRGKGFKSPLTFQVENPVVGVVAQTGKVSSAGTKLTLRADTTVTSQSGQVRVTASGGGQSQSVNIAVATAGQGAAAAPAPVPATVAATPPTAAPTAPPTAAPTVPPTAPPAPTTLGPPKYTLVLNAPKYYGSPGEYVDVAVSVVPEPGRQTREINMRISGLPAGATFTPENGYSATSTVFRIFLASTTSVGTTQFTVRGVRDGVQASTTATLEVIRLQAGMPNPVTVKQGETADFAITPLSIIDSKLPTLFISDGWVSGAKVNIAQFTNGFAKGNIVTTAATPKGTSTVLVTLTLGNLTGTGTFSVTVV